jgi:hypothetical protein
MIEAQAGKENKPDDCSKGNGRSENGLIIGNSNGQDDNTPTLPQDSMPHTQTLRRTHRKAKSLELSSPRSKTPSSPTRRDRRRSVDFSPNLIDLSKADRIVLPASGTTLVKNALGDWTPEPSSPSSSHFPSQQSSSTTAGYSETRERIDRRLREWDEEKEKEYYAKETAEKASTTSALQKVRLFPFNLQIN